MQPTFNQLQLADRKLFQLLAEKTRSGIQATPSGRPVDEVFENTWMAPEVLHSAAHSPTDAEANRSGSSPAEGDPAWALLSSAARSLGALKEGQRQGQDEAACFSQTSSRAGGV